MNIIKYKNILFIISGITIVPGLIFLFMFGLRPSIEFTGGSVGEYKVKKTVEVSQDKIKKVVETKTIQVHSIKKLSHETFSIQTSTLTEGQHTDVLKNLQKAYPSLSERSFQTVGATIGRETEANALKAVLIASVAITLYIAFAFRKVSQPVASWKFGVCAVIALIHDVLVVVGVFAILGYFFHVEIDSLFITALLTVMGFSVHDTIVVFDRIRENLKKNPRLPFDETVNHSILETINRSLNTSLTVVLVLFMMLLFGGASIRWFVVALLAGVVSGTYSSIFNASPLLVAWYEFDKKRRKA